MSRVRPFASAALAIGIAVLVATILGVIPPAQVAVAEGNDGGGCDGDTCPPDTLTPIHDQGPTGVEITVVNLLLRWLVL